MRDRTFAELMEDPTDWFELAADLTRRHAKKLAEQRGDSLAHREATGESSLCSAVEAERFWSKVDMSGDCWLWTAGTTEGYGYFWVKKRHFRAHRLAYELLVGPIPEGLTLDHLCRNRACVNPAHLEPVTQRENVLRGEGHTANNARKTHCQNGHEFTEANTFITVLGRRVCRTCKIANEKRWRDSRRASVNVIQLDSRRP